MVVGVHRRAVGVFSNRRNAEQALHELKHSGFPMDRVSVIARDADREDDIAGTPVQERVGDKADDGAKVGAATGGALGGLTGLLVGLGALAIPGIGPVMLAGAAATTLATTLAGAGIGAVAGSLIGALIGLGIPEERARVYNERVQRGDYLVIIDGTDAEIAQAEAILHQRGVEEFGVYNHPNSEHTTSNVVAGDVVGTKHAVGYFSHRQDAEAAITDLRYAGFPLSHISLIHRQPLEGETFAGINVSDRFEHKRFGLPDPRGEFYNERIKQGDYVVVVGGTDAEIEHAAAIMSQHKVQQWQIFEPNGRAAAPTQRAKRAIGVFSHRRDTEAALAELRDAGFPLNQVSIIAKNTDGTSGDLWGQDTESPRINGVDRNLPRGNKADEGAKAGAATGGVLGGLGGLLVGLGALAIPGIGPVIAGGAVATALATTLTGGAIGAAAGGIGGGLVGLGIPEDRARIYSDRFQRGDYLVILDGTETEIHHAQTILKRRGIEEFAIYDATDLRTEHRPDLDRGVHRETPVADLNRGDRSVVIVDNRDERV
ncbi:general stress protein [Calothrix sp. PCC 7507]|uniref:general stress protein n=1 Tax=Calothrix sp. PCC 7507 TaxID=99598 RepID=UPI00029ED46D|nr:general stress protein [Calothrix sp. PCC 7507]AFY34685.1 signal transduction histidine kinase LytS [Calothrix sp. PCC 7507]